jgi:hypothetical protein
MEIFFDFGLFELLAAAGLAAISRTIYSRRLIAPIFLAASVIAPVLTLVGASHSFERTTASLSVAFGLVNAAVIAAVLQAGELPQLRIPRPLSILNRTRRQNKRIR